MNDHPNLDFSWISSALDKRGAGFSTVVGFETADPVRHQQVIATLAQSRDYGDAPMWAYDPWRGLLGFDPRLGGFSPSPMESPEDDSGRASLETCLRRMDTALRGSKTVLLLRGIESLGADRLVLSQAIGSWANDPEILEQGSVVVLLAASLGRILDEAALSAVAVKRPDLCSADERRWVIRDRARMLEVALGGDDAALVSASSGLSIHQIQTLLVEGHALDGAFDPRRLQELKKKEIERSDLVDVEVSGGTGFAGVGGYDAVKRLVLDSLVAVSNEPERARALGLALPRGILLFGPPGTGKTLFARALARETGLPFLNLRTENLFSKWLGESGHRFRDALDLVEQMSPAIVFVDEIDRFGRRAGGSDGASQEVRRVFSQVLEWLGDPERRAIVIGATNRPEDLDEAFLRPGRFDAKVPFLYPGAASRRRILEIHLGRAGDARPILLEVAGGDIASLLDDLSAATPHFSGAELEQLVTRAKRRAFTAGRSSLREDDLREAAAAFRVGAQARLDEVRHHLRLAERFTDDVTFLEELRREHTA